MFELSQVLAAWKGCLSRAQGIDERALTHVQHAKILQQEDTWPVEVDPNFGRGAYGFEDVPLTGEFPNKRDERTINIHISTLQVRGDELSRFRRRDTDLGMLGICIE